MKLEKCGNKENLRLYWTAKDIEIVKETYPDAYIFKGDLIVAKTSGRAKYCVIPFQEKLTITVRPGKLILDKFGYSLEEMYSQLIYGDRNIKPIDDYSGKPCKFRRLYDGYCSSSDLSSRQAKASKILKNNWAKNKDKMIISFKNSWKDNDLRRENQSRLFSSVLKNCWSNKEYCEKMKNILKELWKDENYRNYHLSILNSEEARENHSFIGSISSARNAFIANANKHNWSNANFYIATLTNSPNIKFGITHFEDIEIRKLGRNGDRYQSMLGICSGSIIDIANLEFYYKLKINNKDEEITRDQVKDLFDFITEFQKDYKINILTNLKLIKDFLEIAGS